MSIKNRLVSLFVFISLIAQSNSFGSARVPSPGFYDNAVNAPTFDLLRSAKSSIDIEIYQMGDLDIRAILRASLQKGVKVRIVKDPATLGETCKVFTPIAAGDTEDCRDQKKLVAEVRASGGEFEPFNKAALCGSGKTHCYEHGKMILVDRKTVLLSTGNFNSSNLCNLSQNPDHCNRDFSVISTDQSIVNTLTSIFERDLAGKSYDLEALLSGSIKDKITVSPFSLSPLVQFIGSARETLLIENQYLKDPTLNQAITLAAKRGVKVQIVLASLCSFGMPDSGEIDRLDDQLIEFEQAGVRLKMFNRSNIIQGKPGYMHAKAIVVDGKKAWVGSVNGSTLSLTVNREYGIFMTAVAQVKKLEKIIEADFLDPQSETWQESARCEKDRGTQSMSSKATRKNPMIKKLKKKTKPNSTEIDEVLESLL